MVRSDGKPYCNAEWKYLPAYVVRCMEPRGHKGHHVSGLAHTYTWPQRDSGARGDDRPCAGTGHCEPPRPAGASTVRTLDNAV